MEDSVDTPEEIPDENLDEDLEVPVKVRPDTYIWDESLTILENLYKIKETETNISLADLHRVEEAVKDLQTNESNVEAQITSIMFYVDGDDIPMSGFVKISDDTRINISVNHS